jgi:hypothetical protein
MVTSAAIEVVVGRNHVASLSIVTSSDEGMPVPAPLCYRLLH